jgi:hypothetical protein
MGLVGMNAGLRKFRAMADMANANRKKKTIGSYGMFN